MFKKVYVFFTLLSMVLFLTACATAPVTGRRQLILIDPQTEMKLGLQAYREILQKAKLCKDPKINALVERVGWRLARAAHRPEFKWEFKVIDDPKTINAFCLPGGKVFVYTGIFKIARTEAELATVLGHEIGHALAHHGAERMSLVLLAGLGEEVLAHTLHWKNPRTRELFLMAYGLGATVGVILPYSRKQELEADEIGVYLMAKACYDPQVALEFWRKMIKLAQKRPHIPVFLATHPPDEVRLKHLEKIMPKMLKIYQDHCPVHHHQGLNQASSSVFYASSPGS